MTLGACFWDRVDQSGECWLWTGPDNGRGYGRAWIEGELVYTHRAAWIDANGPIPDGLVLDHLCRTTLCVRPAHLEPVTQRINTIRGRGSVTECIHGHTFDEANTYWVKGQTRMCRRCRADREARRRAQTREVAA